MYAGPVLATRGILTFLSSWNSFLWPLVGFLVLQRHFLRGIATTGLK